jgi:glutamate synthase domain-containing protein 3
MSGAGMTGGTLFLRIENERFINTDYLTRIELQSSDEAELLSILAEYVEKTNSTSAKQIVASWETTKSLFGKFVPRSALTVSNDSPSEEEDQDIELLKAANPAR